MMKIKILNIKFNLFKGIFLFLIILFSSQQANADTATFSYTGAQQTFTVPSGVTSITVEGYGAAGGAGESSGSTKSNGGLGGYLKATISVTPGDTLYINIGGVGESGANIGNAVSAGGFNGGGDSANSYSTDRNGGGGGGATDIRTSTNLSDRIFVVGAGGGGGGGTVSGTNSNGGAGGGTSGEDGTDGEGSAKGLGGGGGSQSSGGSRGTGNSTDNEHGIAGALGVGGDESINGGDANCKEGNGGGGAGYYGGGSGGCGHGRSITGGGGGGGSSYTTGTIITNTQGHSSATGNGSLEIEYSASSTNPNPTTDKDIVGSIDIQSHLAKNYVGQSINVVSNRLSYLKQNRGSDNLSKQNIKLDFGNAILTSLTNELLAKNDKSIIPDNWSAWSEGSISVSKIGDRNGSSSKETHGQALAFGLDKKLNNNNLWGFAIQYAQSDTDVGTDGTNVDSENINLSIYQTLPLDNNNFIEGLYGVGLIESDLLRKSGANTLTGSRDATQIFGSINFGKTIDKGDFNLTPIGRVDLGYTELDAYSETGTDALSYAKQTIESGLASLGFEFSDIVKLNKNSFKPFGSIEYGLDFSNSSDAKMNYVSDTSTIYTYTQGINSNHLITSVVGFEYITKDNLEIISSYKRIQGNESEKTDIIKFGINFKSKQETEYAMSIDGSEDLKAGFDISKNINGFDLKFNANQAFNENSDQTAKVSLTKKF